MKKIVLPPEYKDYYHINQEDLDKINEHIERFEKEKQQKKIIKRYIWGLIFILFISIIIFGVMDLSDLKKLLKGNPFLINEQIKTSESEIEIKITRPSEKIINIICTSSKPTKLIISNSLEHKEVIISEEAIVENMKYDSKLFLINGKEKFIINIENLKPIE
ncbi:MAG: hypothetical protein ACPL4C_02880 [Brevinematia bacterium]